MAFYGTYVLARSAALLPHVSGMRSAFGSRCMLIGRHQEGWQLAGLKTPMHHEWPAIHGGPVPLAEATGAPALAVWVSESSCLQYAAATPDGRSWTAHFADEAEADADVEGLIARGAQLPEGRCGYDHHEFCTLRLPEGVDVPPDDQAALGGNLLEWAAAAGLDTTAERILDALGTTTDETAVYALVAALGLEPLLPVEPLFDVNERDWRDAYRRGEDESTRVCREWTSRGEQLPDYDQPLPGADEFVKFLDLVAASRFGGGFTRAQLQAEAQRLGGRLPQAMTRAPHGLRPRHRRLMAVLVAGGRACLRCSSGDQLG